MSGLKNPQLKHNYQIKKIKNCFSLTIHCFHKAWSEHGVEVFWDRRAGKKNNILLSCPKLHAHFRPYESHVLAVKIEHS